MVITSLANLSLRSSIRALSIAIWLLSNSVDVSIVRVFILTSTDSIFDATPYLHLLLLAISHLLFLLYSLEMWIYISIWDHQFHFCIWFLGPTPHRIIYLMFHIYWLLFRIYCSFAQQLGVPWYIGAYMFSVYLCSIYSPIYLLYILIYTFYIVWYPGDFQKTWVNRHQYTVYMNST